MPIAVNDVKNNAVECSMLKTVDLFFYKTFSFKVFSGGPLLLFREASLVLDFILAFIDPAIGIALLPVPPSQVAKEYALLYSDKFRERWVVRARASEAGKGVF